MPLTVVVGSSGSGKTTFLNDVHQRHKCTYLRQYHNIRPYIPVTSIPNFDPTQLPFWHLYESQGTASQIQVGGTMAGRFIAGLSGGQRKLLLFELLYQRTMSPECSQILLVLDEPFAGVTDDFVPFILERLNAMRQTHNILLVTNDHVQQLVALADNTLTVSAIDRTKVQLGDVEENAYYDREKAILAISWGEQYQYPAFTTQDLRFFWETEVVGKGAGVRQVLAFIILSFALFLMTFWSSENNSAPLVLIGASSISFFVISPYLLSLVDWRNYITEEAEALVHSSKGMNKFLKTMLTLSLILFISILQYEVLQLTIGNLNGWDFWIAMLFDSASLQFPFICFGIYTTLPHMTVEILSGCPFLFMIFFSTTYSPNAGLPVIKELRYLFARYYLFCMTPVVEHVMEGCPTNPNINLMLLILTGCLCVLLFILYLAVLRCFKQRHQKHLCKSMMALELDTEFKKLQLKLSSPSSSPPPPSPPSSGYDNSDRKPATRKTTASNAWSGDTSLSTTQAGISSSSSSGDLSDIYASFHAFGEVGLATKAWPKTSPPGYLMTVMSKLQWAIATLLLVQQQQLKKFGWRESTTDSGITSCSSSDDDQSDDDISHHELQDPHLDQLQDPHLAPHQDQLQDPHLAQHQDPLLDQHQDQLQDPHQDQLQDPHQDQLQDPHPDQLLAQLQDPHQDQLPVPLQDPHPAQLPAPRQDLLPAQLQDPHQDPHQDLHPDQLQDQLQDLVPAPHLAQLPAPLQDLLPAPHQDPHPDQLQDPLQDLVPVPHQDLVPAPHQDLLPAPLQDLLPAPHQDLPQDLPQDELQDPHQDQLHGTELVGEVTN